MESPQQSVPMLTAAAALTIIVAAGGQLSHVRQALAVDITQLESWRATVMRTMEPGALQQLHQRACSSSVPAQSVLGEALLSTHNGALRNEGIRWLETAASSGTRAQLSLDRTLLLGISGVKRGYPHTLRLLHQPVSRDDTAAAYYLGVVYRSGYGTAVDTTQTAHWFDHATCHEIPTAIFMLANAYRDDDGVPRGEAHALALYQDATEHGLPETVQALAMAYRNGELDLKRDDAAYHQQWIETAHALRRSTLMP